MDENVLSGSCHCGDVSYRFESSGPAAELPLRACQCTFCTRSDAVWTSDPEGSLDVYLARPQSVIQHRFGTGTARFLVCGRCGVLVLAVSDIDGCEYAVLNLRSAGTDTRDPVGRTRTGFDGEGTSDRLARRRRNWIPKVRFHTRRVE